MYREATTATIMEDKNNPGESGGTVLKKAATPSRPRIAASGTKTSLFRRSA
jgi:hypothetical protein